jgi:hypothetical protein
MEDKELNDILSKYRDKLGDHIDVDSIGQSKRKFDESFSKEYKTFRNEITSKNRSRYEKWCNAAEKAIKFKPDAKTLPKLKEAIEISHLKITPEGASSFAVIAAFMILALALLAGLISNLDVISGVEGASASFMLPLVLIILSFFALKFLTKLPILLAARWRLKASNQMVICILYIIIYLRNTSNLEHAIKFAAEHIGEPLSLDLRKIFWDVEIGKYSTIKESLDNYLITWRKYNLEFVTAFHLIQGSLYEPSKDRRTDLLEKGLKVILDGTYDKMMHFAQDMKAPITTLHMLGVILPILGLVMFPLVGSLMGGSIKWYHLMIIYNIILPLAVYSMGMNLLSKRPTGYQESRYSKEVLKKKNNPLHMSIAIALVFVIIGFAPLIAAGIYPGQDISFNAAGTTFSFFDFREGPEGEMYGPFGIGALLISFISILGIAYAVKYYYKQKTKGLIEIRKETEELEKEFAGALFQLGNRIGEGIPAESSFKKVSEVMEGTPTGKFFKIIDVNIRSLGMGLKEAIFNPKTGAILHYPSPLVESSMEVLLESSKKGPAATSKALISISTYLEKIHRVNERLKDLLAEVVSSMKSQVAFLTPMIAGVVVGVSAMVVSIIVDLHQMFATQLSGGVAGDTSMAGVTQVVNLFQIQGIIPGYYFQLIVGLYVIQLAVVLSLIQNGVESAGDKIKGEALLAKSVWRSTVLYVLIGIVVVIVFTVLAKGVISASTVSVI